jgi:hypothetical protein
VSGEDPRAFDFSPRNLGRGLYDFLGQFGRDVPQAPYDGLAREPQRSLSVPALLAEPHQLGRRIDCLSEVCQQIFC